MNTGTLMVQGTTSDAGKSVLVAALCRWLKRCDVSVVPFKPQNMALNSAVTEDGGEIGRAQALQAQACGLPCHTDMNPILLKPNSDTGAQVIIHGKAIGTMEAKVYHDYKRIGREAVMVSHQRLSQQYDAVIVEGAGSPAEINLRHNDIANMGFAEAADCPVIIVADIDRGGVFAHLYGTLALLSESEQARVKGFVINRFRGDIGLLQSGLDWLEEKTGKPVIGVLPYLMGLHLDSEDSVALINSQASEDGDHKLKIVVPVYPRISNHTDFDPLINHPQVSLTLVGPNDTPPPADLIILPGSKSVRADRQWLQDNSWDDAITRHLRYGGKVLGICGGLQILGNAIHDPLGIEGKAGSTEGLGLMDLQTTLAVDKHLRNTKGHLADGTPIEGYEIHAGETTGAALNRPAMTLERGTDGALSEDGQIMGTYLHGLFEDPDACSSLLRWAGAQNVTRVDHNARREQSIDALADAVETHLDTRYLLQLLGTCSD